MQSLFAAIRKAAPSSIWSQGVELSRNGRAFLERREGDTLEVRVSEPGKTASARVTLYIEDDDWSCECRSPHDACIHATAAVIGLKQNTLGGSKAPSKPAAIPQNAPSTDSKTDSKTDPKAQSPKSAPEKPVLRVYYDFVPDVGGLALIRKLGSGQAAAGEAKPTLKPLVGTLAAQKRKRTEGETLLIGEEDLRIEIVLGSYRRGALAPKLAHKILSLLEDAPRVGVQGCRVKVLSPKPSLRAFLDQDADANLCFQVQRIHFEHVFANRIAHHENSLHPIVDHGLSPEKVQAWIHGIKIPKSRHAQWLQDDLPQIRRALPIEIRCTLPKRVRVTPHLKLESQTDNSQTQLTVLATLVYGNPPLARLDADTLYGFGGDIPLRDTRAEARLKNELKKTLDIPLGHRGLWRGAQAAEVGETLRAMQRKGAQLVGDGHTTFYCAPILTPEVVVSDSDVHVVFAAAAHHEHAHALQTTHLPVSSDFDPETHSTTHQAQTQAVMQAWQEGADRVRLDHGGWAELPLDWLEKHGPMLQDLLAARGNRAQLPKAALADAAKFCRALGHPEPAAFAAIRALLTSNANPHVSPSKMTQPSGLQATLRPYQASGLAWLQLLAQAGLGGILADDMGLGKTLQALAAIQTPALVVCPTSLLANWKAEIARFRPGLKVHTYHGSKRHWDPRAEVTLTSYALLRLDTPLLAQTVFSTLIFDESQALKNPRSQTAQAAFTLQGDFRIALSGTPVENRLQELWSQVELTNPGWLGTLANFEQRYAAPIAAGDTHIAARLRQRLAPFMLRRTKAMVAPDLPPRTEKVVFCELSEAERAIYNSMQLLARKEVVEKLGKGQPVLQALEALLRLRQAACHPGLLPGHTRWLGKSSSKIQWLVEQLNVLIPQGHKALIFSQWTSLLDRAQESIANADIPTCRLDGQTRDRAAVVDRFQAEDGPPVMLLSLKAGGVGLNLTAADHVFILDPWWNPAAENQAADRAHRIGQQRPVIIHRLVAQNTVEEGILALKQQKQALSDATIHAGQKTIGHQDLLALLDGDFIEKPTAEKPIT